MRRGRIVFTGLVLVMIVLVGGLLALVDFQAALVLVGGFGAAALVSLVLNRAVITERTRVPVRGGMVVVLVGVLVMGIVVGLLALMGPVIGAVPGDVLFPEDYIVLEPQDAGDNLDTATSQPETIAVVTDLRLLVTPAEGRLRSFIVEPTLTLTLYQGFEVNLGEREVTLTPVTVRQDRLGFLLREANLGVYNRRFDILVDGKTYSLNPCEAGCPPTTIELRDMPKGAFYDAREALDLQRDVYVNTETVIWRVERLTRPIVFAFVPPPFNAVRGVLTPLLGAATLNDWVLGVAGLVGGVAVLPLTQSFLQDWAEGKIAETVRRRRSKRREKRRASQD